MCAKCQGQLGHFNSSVFKVSVCPSPDLVSASVTVFVTWFTTICKLAPWLFNVRLVDMKMSDLAISHKRRWRNPLVVREQRLGNLVLTLGQTAPWATCGHQCGSNITCSPLPSLLRTKNQFWQQSWERRGLGLQLPKLCEEQWARPGDWRVHQAPNITGLHRPMMMVSVLPYTEITMSIKYGQVGGASHVECAYHYFFAGRRQNR